MINYFPGRTKCKVLALIALLLCACEGVNIRVFPQSTQSKQDMKAVLAYEPTRCVPFISCHFEWSILSGAAGWELNSAKSIVIEQALLQTDIANSRIYTPHGCCRLVDMS